MAAGLVRGLTMNARVTLMAAHQEAARAGATRVCSDHLLAAILERPDAPVRAVLASVGTDPETVLANLRQRVGACPPVALAIDAVPQMVTVDAGKEAHALGDDQIDDVHLLLGLLRDPTDPAGATLQAAGLTLDEARRTLRQSRPVSPLGTDRIVAWSPAPSKLRTSDRELRRTADGVLVIDGPRRGWSRRASLPSRPLAELSAATKPSPIFCALLAVFLGSGALLAVTDPTPRVARFFIVALIVSGWVASVCVHEYGHAAVAFLGGDREVADIGALSLDPRKYVSPMFSVVLPLVVLLAGRIPLPGGAVRIRRSNLRSRPWHLAVSAGGPFGTLACLLLFSLPFLLGLPDRWPDRYYLWSALSALAYVEASVLVLNLLPIPPLDGFRILCYWLPDEIEIAEYQLGWMPYIFCSMFLSQGPLGDAVWSVGHRISDVLQIPYWLASYGLYQLRL